MRVAAPRSGYLSPPEGLIQIGLPLVIAALYIRPLSLPWILYYTWNAHLDYPYGPQRGSLVVIFSHCRLHLYRLP